MGEKLGAKCVVYMSLVLANTLNGVVSDMFCKIVFGRDARSRVTDFVPSNNNCSA